MTIGGLIGETFIQNEVDFRREKTMQQYNRRPAPASQAARCMAVRPTLG